MQLIQFTFNFNLQTSTPPTIIELEHGHEGLLGHIHFAHGLHPLLALGLLLQKFLLPGDVAAIALGQHILTDGTDAGGGNDPAAD